MNCVDTQTGKNEMDDARRREGEGMEDYQVLIKHRLQQKKHFAQNSSQYVYTSVYARVRKVD